jgi:hypothetical protein
MYTYVFVLLCVLVVIWLAHRQHSQRESLYQRMRLLHLWHHHCKDAGVVYWAEGSMLDAVRDGRSPNVLHTVELVLHASDLHRVVNGLDLMYVTVTDQHGVYSLVSADVKVDIYTVQDEDNYLTFVCNPPRHQFYHKPVSFQLQRIGYFHDNRSSMELYLYSASR